MPQWKQFSGSWTLSQQMQAKGASTWPAPPGAPTIGTATAGSFSATVTFTAPTDPGYPATITQYTVTSSPGGITATGTASPIVVSGLTADTAYTFTVTATNATGTGPASAASNSVTPFAAGALWVWGQGEQGQMGRGVAVQATSSPVQIGSLTAWSALGPGRTDSKIHGIEGSRLFGWGRNSGGFPYDGIIGDNTIISRSSPVQIGSLATWSKVSGGFLHTSAIKDDGTLWTWGINGSGQLGQNDTIDRSSPVQVGALTNWATVSTGNSFWVAIKTDGTMWSCGFNGSGKLGIGSTASVSSPVQIGNLTTWSKISVSPISAFAVKTDGTLWVWGDNDQGQLGTNNRTNYSSPVQVGALTTWLIPQGLGYTAMAIKTDGTLWSWGSNANGILGTNQSPGTDPRRSSPVQVGVATNWASLNNASNSGGNALALKTDGTLWSWGANNNGQVGNNSTSDVLSPVQIGALTTWINASAAGGIAFAIKTA